MSLGLSIVFFVVMATICVFVSSVNKISTESNSSASYEKSGDLLQVMVFYCDLPTNKVFASCLSFDMQQKTISAQTVDCTQKVGEKTLIDVHKTEGFYPFAECCIKMVSTEQLPFVKLNSNTFVIIGDRLKKIVYNDANGQRTLLTSRQAEQMLDKENFSSFCVQYAQMALEKDIVNEFLFVVSNTENSLSYPRLYDSLN